MVILRKARRDEGALATYEASAASPVALLDGLALELRVDFVLRERPRAVGPFDRDAHERGDERPEERDDAEGDALEASDVSPQLSEGDEADFDGWAHERAPIAQAGTLAVLLIGG